MDWGFEKEELRIGIDMGRPDDDVRFEDWGWREGMRFEEEDQGEEVEVFPRRLEGIVCC